MAEQQDLTQGPAFHSSRPRSMALTVIELHPATAFAEMCSIFTASRLRRDAQAKRHAGMIEGLLR